MLLNRSPEQIIVLLAILKTGNAYLPLDPDHPVERLQWILQDSGASVLISCYELSHRIHLQMPVIHLNEVHDTDSKIINPNLEISPNDIAYVIYTSGTTGQPKGVLVKHSNVIQLLFHRPNYFTFSKDDVWTMFHSYCFDFSVWEMYGALLYGGKLILISKSQTHDPMLFLKIIKDEKVTILNQTPTAFYNLLEEEIKFDSNDISLRYIIFGGEALQPAKLKNWKQKYPDTKLINMFGITETTVHVTFKEITYAEIQKNLSNIGRPLPTYKCYVVDRDNNLLPAGITGELLVGGHGVSNGYLNRPELTTTRFIENPFCKGEIVYRSGDLVKYLQNGEMQYLGRMDHQIQLYGFRIELSEIEQVLLTHSDVLDTRVIFKESAQFGKYLCAYVICSEDKDVENLKHYLSAKLPYYMIPGHIIKLDRFPMTTNGKVNVKSLPEPDHIVNINVEKILPRNATEKMIVNIWQRVLGVIGISVKDDFFDLGGDSLRALNAVSMSKRKFSIVDLFKYSVVEDLARHIQSSSKNNYLLQLSETSSLANKICLICIPYGGGDAADFQPLAKDIEKIDKNISVFGVDLPGYNFSRGTEEFQSIKELARNIIKQIKQEGYESFILYGHCVGSALAIALAEIVSI